MSVNDGVAGIPGSELRLTLLGRTLRKDRVEVRPLT